MNFNLHQSRKGNTKYQNAQGSKRKCDSIHNRNWKTDNAMHISEHVRAGVKTYIVFTGNAVYLDQRVISVCKSVKNAHFAHCWLS